MTSYKSIGLIFLIINSVCEGVSPVSRFIPFSTKYPELIIPDESVCLPRIKCARKRSIVP